jgi:hypothetical protein
MNDNESQEMKPAITLTDGERVWESKPDNPNIAEDKRVLGYLKPLHKKLLADGACLN